MGVTRIELEAWLTIEDPAMTVEEAIAVLEGLGNTILQVDDRRLQVAHVISEQA